MKRYILYGLCVLLSYSVNAQTFAEEREHLFEQLANQWNTDGNVTFISNSTTERILNTAMQYIDCDDTHCQCLDIQEVYRLLNRPISGMTEDLLADFSVIILFYYHDPEDACSDIEAATTNFDFILGRLRGETRQALVEALTGLESAGNTPTAGCFDLDMITEERNHLQGSSDIEVVKFQSMLLTVNSLTGRDMRVTCRQPLGIAAKIGYGTLSVFIVCLLALLGVLFIPCLKKKNYYVVGMSFFLGLAVGTLTADALLHLIPEAFGLHDHGPGEEHGDSHGHGDEDGHGHGDEDEDDHNHVGSIVIEDFVLKALAIIFSILGYFICESLLEIMCGHNYSGQTISSGSNSLLKWETTRQPSGPSTMIQVAQDENQDSKKDVQNSTPSTVVQVAPENTENPEERSDVQNSTLAGESTRANAGTVESEEAYVPCLRRMKCMKEFRGTRPVAWMIILGDGLHNFADGLAIGGAFSDNAVSGFMTSLAVIFHELPHELGDFAVLINSGMSITKAAVFNFVSAVTAFLGLYIGLAIAVNRQVQLWIFVLTAGIFLYIALVDMIPELMRLQRSGNRLKLLCIQVLGYLIGIFILFLTAIFEESLL